MLNKASSQKKIAELFIFSWSLVGNRGCPCNATACQIWVAQLCKNVKNVKKMSKNVKNVKYGMPGFAKMFQKIKNWKLNIKENNCQSNATACQIWDARLCKNVPPLQNRSPILEPSDFWLNPVFLNICILFQKLKIKCVFGPKGSTVHSKKKSKTKTKQRKTKTSD